MGSLGVGIELGGAIEEVSLQEHFQNSGWRVKVPKGSKPSQEVPVQEKIEMISRHRQACKQAQQEQARQVLSIRSNRFRPLTLMKEDEEISALDFGCADKIIQELEELVKEICPIGVATDMEVDGEIFRRPTSLGLVVSHRLVQVQELGSLGRFVLKAQRIGNSSQE